MNKKIALIIGILVIVLLIVALLIPQKEKVYEEDLLGIDYNTKDNITSLNYDTENQTVALYIQNYGSVVIELYPDIAPNTVNNFISLIKNKFYDNNTFHRLVPGFVLQGGDPKGDGTGGPNYTIEGEFTNNNFQNDLLHDKWVVSMARSSDNNSAGSQFFICLDKASNLDGEYAAFGKVIDGFKNIEKIVDNEVVIDQDSGKLQNNLTIKKALVDLKGKEYPEVVKYTN